MKTAARGSDIAARSHSERAAMREAVLDTMAWHEARALAHRVAVPLQVEDVALADAAGRTLAYPVVARAALPGFDNSAMDGYAVRGSGPWRLKGRILAGQAPPIALQDGQAAEVATGAPVPAGSSHVIPYEEAHRAGDLVSAHSPGRSHIRRAGEYIRIGQEVLAAGSLLRPAALGLAASVGIDTVSVRRRARVRLLVTGDEVVASGVPRYGRVRDAIGPAMAALLPAWGADVESVTPVPDTANALADVVGASVSTADLTVVCGASSVGPADHLHDVVRDLGGCLHIDGVACRPGHPQLLARARSGWIVGLPGNPYAAFVAACTIVAPLLAGLAGSGLAALPRAALAGDVPHRRHHTSLVPVRRCGDGVELIKGAHSGHLGAVAEAEALAVIPPGTHGDAAVELIILPGA